MPRRRVDSLTKDLELVRIGPRQEQIEAMRGRVRQARGEVALRQTFLDATIIKAPITGTILERAVEKGEFVTDQLCGRAWGQGICGFYGRPERPAGRTRYQPG